MSEEIYWQQGDQRAYPPLRGRRTADAVVIGGGLTGLTVALWLCRAGLRVILLEARTLGSGSTACCLGRVSLMGGTSLAKLDKCFGQEWASACASARQNAFYALQEFSREEKAAWDWRSLDDRMLGVGKTLSREADALRRAGVPVETEKTFSARFTGEDSLVLRNMAALHPLRYLRFLARQGEKRGLKIFEHSRVVALETNLASTERGSVQAPYIVVATGYPIVNTPGWYFLRTIQRKGCLLPLENAAGLEEMLGDLDGRFALRPIRNGALAQLTLSRVGEISHRPPTELYRERLAPYLESLPTGQWYGGTEVYSADGLPYIGPYGRRTPNLFVAAAYGGQGILGSITAAQLDAFHFAFGKIGELIELDESEFETFSAIAGCGVAYVYMFIDAMARAGLKNGLSKQKALSIAASAVMGSAKLVSESGMHPYALIDSVTTPGGTTIEGVLTLQRCGFESAVHAAIQASIDKELGMK